ncbi:MAG: heparan-alpha-glucosaminide N-acetyltransferase [Phyllobacterium sp.]|uniref:heparan-alpha-glucosaminide N-acetyltransferase n=1 Tax=Phyllobacterium sp. TaxID=1871046 RepID=UPI0030F0EA38
MADKQSSISPAKPRLGKLDVLRGIALVAMATYHTAWDFEFFGYLEPGTTGQGAWKLYARVIASTFLVLVGFSLVLAHGRGIRWRSFLVRLAQVVAAAMAITLVTWYMTPESFVFFGILHEIAAASVLGLLFLRLPVLVIAIAAAGVIAAPHYLISPSFDPPLLWPLGLSEILIRSNDFVPIFPWFGAVLTGMALGKLMQQTDTLKLLAGNIVPAWLNRLLQIIGRHSLAFYLIHQPVLISCVFLISHLFPPAVASPEEIFGHACVQSCSIDNEAAFCEKFCACVVDESKARDVFDDAFAGRRDQTDPEMQEIAGLCTQQNMPQ